MAVFLEAAADLFLLSANNKVATFCPTKGITICKKNINRLVSRISELNPEFLSIPIGILSVSTLNEIEIQKVYTDWVIHYYSNNRDLDSICQWNNLWHKQHAQKLRYIGMDNSPQDDGVYLWPLPFLIKNKKSAVLSTQCDSNMLIWVAYCLTSNESKWMNDFSLVASSFAVIAQKPDKDNALSILENINQSFTLSEPTFYVATRALLKHPGGGEETRTSWNILINAIEKSEISPRRFKGTYLALGNFISFLEVIKGTINEMLNMSETSDSDNAGETITDPLTTTSSSKGRSSPSTQKLYQPTKDPMISCPITKQPFTSRQPHSLSLGHNDEQMGTSPILLTSTEKNILNDASVVETSLEEARQISSNIKESRNQHRPSEFSMAMNTNIHNQCKDPLNIRGRQTDFSVATQISLWTENVPDFANLDKLLEQLALDKKSSKIVYMDVQKIREIINEFIVSLRNLHGNPICCQRQLDDHHCTELLESAYQQAIQSWQACDLDARGYSFEILSSLKHNMIQLQNMDNDTIVRKENKILQAVSEKLKQEYIQRLKQIMENVGHNINMKNIHHKMVAECLRIFKKSTKYCGNHYGILHEATQSLESLLSDSFRDEMKSMSQPNETLECLPDSFSAILEAYNIAIRHALLSQTLDDPVILNKVHEGIVIMVLENTSNLEREDVILILNSHWMNILEFHLFQLALTSCKSFTSNMALYLTNDWIWVRACTGTLGSGQIKFSGPSGQQFGFPALLTNSKTGFNMGCDAFKLMYEKGSQITEHGSVFQFITDDGQDSLRMTTRFILSTKVHVEKLTKHNMPQVIIVIPSWFTFQETNRLRESCKNADFQQCTLLTESSATAYSHFLSTSTKPWLTHKPLILVVIAQTKFLRMEIFEALNANGEMIGVTHLSAASKTWSLFDRSNPRQLPKDFLSTAISVFETVSQKLNLVQRDSLRYYTVIPEFSGWTDIFNEYFRSENLIRLQFNLDQVFLDVFSSFGNHPTSLVKFLDILAGVAKNQNE